MKCLIIKSKWCDLILNGLKDIELRGSNTNIRGKIYLIKSGTKQIYGTIELIDSFKLSDSDYYALKNRHRVEVSRKDIKYKNLYGWILKNPIKFTTPIPYKHKQGCVIWVNIS